MEITKERVDNIIADFKKEKKSFAIDQRYLTKFDRSDTEQAACFSYMRGEKGGAYIPFLAYLTEKLQFETIVELGNQTGMSTIAFYSALKKNKKGVLYTVDVAKDQRFCPDEMFTDSQVSFLFGDVCSNEIIQKLPRNIDFLFTDTLHYNFQMQDEWRIYQHLLADTALVAIDDIRSNDKNILFDNIAFPKWDLTELCHESGWGLFLYQRKQTVADEARTKNITNALISVWEGKTARLQKITESQSKTFWIKIKHYLKKMRPLYQLYVKIYNWVHYNFFRKSVKFYER